jgi:hypothetical protein
LRLHQSQDDMTAMMMRTTVNSMTTAMAKMKTKSKSPITNRRLAPTTTTTSVTSSSRRRRSLIRSAAAAAKDNSAAAADDDEYEDDDDENKTWADVYQEPKDGGVGVAAGGFTRLDVSRAFTADIAPEALAGATVGLLYTLTPPDP